MKPTLKETKIKILQNKLEEATGKKVVLKEYYEKDIEVLMDKTINDTEELRNDLIQLIDKLPGDDRFRDFLDIKLKLEFLLTVLY